MSTPGLKTLTDRLNKLESAPGTPAVVTAPTSSFTDKIITAVTSSLTNDLESVLKLYSDGLKDIGVNLDNLTLVDLIKIVPYTVVFVEKNIKNIAGIIKQIPSSALKLTTAISFITNYIEPEAEHLVALIESYVDLLFHEGKDTLKGTLKNTSKTDLRVPPQSISKATSRKLFFRKSMMK